MAPLPADHAVVDASLASEDRQYPVLPNQPSDIGATSYERYLKICILKNLDRPELVTPALIDATYLGWLSGIGDADLDRVRKVFAEKDSAGAFRLWCDNEGRKVGYASRYSSAQLGLGQWAIARNGPPGTMAHPPTSRTQTALGPKRVATTNFIYDRDSQKVFVLPPFFKHALHSIVFEEFRHSFKTANPQFDKAGTLSPERVWRAFRAFVEVAFAFAKPEVIEAALEKARVTTVKDGSIDFNTSFHPGTKESISVWKCDMILLPHCVRYSQLSPSYEEFCQATQAINSVILITEEVMNEAWRAVFECRVGLGKMTRIAADRAIAASSSPYAKLFWNAAAKIDAESPPMVQKRPTIEEYDESVNLIYPTYLSNRMLSIDKVGEGLIIPLSQPTWCLRPLGEEFASFTTFIEWLNADITYEQVVEAWNGLAWDATGVESRTTWARQQNVGPFAEKHWGHGVVTAETRKREEETELRKKMAKLSKVRAPPMLRSNELRRMPIERPKTGWRPSQGHRQPHHLHTPTAPRASTPRRSSAPGPTTRPESLFTRLQDPNSTLRARGESAPRRRPVVGQRLSLTKPA